MAAAFSARFVPAAPFAILRRWLSPPRLCSHPCADIVAQARNTLLHARVMRTHASNATEKAVKSPFAPVVLPLAALIASLVRWWLQGSGNLYTALDKRLYVPDRDLGWRIADHHPIWLGLEVCAVIAAIAVGIAISGWLVRRIQSARPALAKALVVAAWLVGALTLIVPIAAFASGGGIEGARDTLPDNAGAGPVAEGISGSLDLPKGRYDVIAHSGSSITARVKAGGEAFDARFSGDIRGTFMGDPGNLRAPVSGKASVAAASVDTGVRPRSNSARDEYLQAAKYPRIEFRLDEMLAARAEAPNRVAFRAKGQLELIGNTHVVEVTGTLSKPDEAALARLGLSGAILLVQADFAIIIKETALAPDAGDFDGDRIPIHVSLVLRHAGD